VKPVEVEDVVGGIKEEPVALTPENESHLIDQQVQRKRLAILDEAARTQHDTTRARAAHSGPEYRFSELLAC
jgi:hypothetical protein